MISNVQKTNERDEKTKKTIFGLIQCTPLKTFIINLCDWDCDGLVEGKWIVSDYKLHETLFTSRLSACLFVLDVVARLSCLTLVTHIFTFHSCLFFVIFRRFRQLIKSHFKFNDIKMFRGLFWKWTRKWFLLLLLFFRQHLSRGSLNALTRLRLVLNFFIGSSDVKVIKKLSEKTSMREYKLTRFFGPVSQINFIDEPHRSLAAAVDDLRKIKKWIEREKKCEVQMMRSKFNGLKHGQSVVENSKNLAQSLNAKTIDFYVSFPFLFFSRFLCSS